MDESRGMKRYEREEREPMRRDTHASHEGMRGGYYHGTTGVYKQTMGDERWNGGPNLEDMKATANLPRDVINTTYPNSYGDMPFGYYDDSMHGIDSQMRQDHGTAMKQFMPRKGF